ncbi:MAG: DinB family protein [Saprospiraceae bacterium]|nr:DinB family protein [Saprospiraceae bacterium]
MHEKDQIIALLKNTVDGSPWYGKSISNTLRDVPIGKALLRLGGSYNIVELVHHMLAWRRYGIRILETGQHEEVPEHINFPTIEVMMMEEWDELILAFKETQEKLIETIEKNQRDLNASPDNKPYTYSQILRGVIHHDIYHTGQINLLTKFL